MTRWVLAILTVLTFMVGSPAFVPIAEAQDEGCWLESANSVGGTGQLLRSSGSPALDRALNAELAFAQTAMRVRPIGWFLDDRGSPNAYADGARNRIMLGIELLERELRRARGELFSVSAIITHEVAHILQYQREGRNRGRYPTKTWELQADYLAGWLMSGRGNFAYTDVRPALRTFYELGDTNFTNSNHHGTSEERLAAIEAGYRTSQMPIDRAYGSALEFARGLGPVPRLSPRVTTSVLSECSGLCSGFKQFAGAAMGNLSSFCSGENYRGPTVRVAGILGVVDSVSSCEQGDMSIVLAFEGLSRAQAERFVLSCKQSCPAAVRSENDQEVVLRDGRYELGLVFPGNPKRSYVNGRWMLHLEGLLQVSTVY